MGDRHGLSVRLTAARDVPPLPEDVRGLLFESVRELIFNAVKHAGMHSVRVDVRQRGGKELFLVVSDFERCLLSKVYSA